MRHNMITPYLEDFMNMLLRQIRRQVNTTSSHAGIWLKRSHPIA